LAGRLGLLLVRLAVVGFVEVVDITSGFGDGFGFLLLRGGVAAGQVGVTLFPPFAGRKVG
jgi:hypothetical protein